MVESLIRYFYCNECKIVEKVSSCTRIIEHLHERLVYRLKQIPEEEYIKLLLVSIKLKVDGKSNE